MQDSHIVFALSSFMVREMDYTSLSVSPLTSVMEVISLAVTFCFSVLLPDSLSIFN